MMISKRRQQRISPFVLMFAAVALLLIASGFFFGSRLRGAAAYLFAPIYGAERSVGETVRGFFGGFASKQSLAEENARLRAELADGQLLVLDRNHLYEENLELKERVGRIADPNAITAAVVMAPPRAPYDTLLIDAGAEDDVEAGDKVAAGGTVLIGEIAEVYPKSSRVTLYSAPGSARDGFLARQSLPVSVEGLGSGALQGKIPHGVEVAVGDELAIPSIAGGIMGFVERVEAKEGESFQTIYFRLPINPLSLRYVDIWRL